MSQQLPPLTTLRSFEASARLLSFSRAADELHVTHGAVSRAVRHLEDHLGVKLFRRSVRAVNLTAPGAAYAASVRDVLGRLATATAVIMDQQSVGFSISARSIPSPPSGSFPGCSAFARPMATLRFVSPPP